MLFKRFIGNATSGQVSLFLSVLGIFNILFLWPFIIIFYYTEVESWSFDKIPWDYLCGSAALSVGEGTKTGTPKYSPITKSIQRGFE